MSFFNFKTNYKILSIIFLFIWGIVIYSNTFSNSFHWDDISYIVNNPVIRKIGSLRNIWNYWPSRFITFFSFALNYKIHQLHVFGFHLLSLFFHLGTSVLIFWFLNKILPGQRWIPFFTALIFLTHPIQTEAINYISQRATLIVTFFYLCTVCLYIKAKLAKKRSLFMPNFYYYLSLVVALGGTFTKEIFVTLPLVLWLYDFYFLQTEGKSNWRYILPYFTIWPIFLMVMFVYKPLTFGDIQRLLDNPIGNSSQYLFTQFRVLVTYLRLILVPVRQNLDYDYPVSTSFWTVPNLLGIFILLSLIFLGIRLFSKYKLISFGIFWFFITLLPESSIIPLLDVIFEHRLYLPMVGYSIVFASSLDYFFIKKKRAAIAIVTLSLLVGIFSILSYHRNTVWKDEVTLWSNVIKESPHKVRPYNERAVSYLENGDYDNAIIDLNQALRLDRNFVLGLQNRAMAFLNKGEYKKAIADFSEVITLKPNIDAYIHRGLGYYLNNEYEKSIVDFTQVLKSYPKFQNTIFLSEIEFVKVNKKELAIELYRKIVKSISRDAVDYFKLGVIYNNSGKKEEAIEAFKKSIEYNPHYLPAYSLLMRVYKSLGNKELVISLCKKIITNNLNYFDAYYQMANIYKDIKKEGEAIKLYKRAIKINPDSEQAYFNLGTLYLSMGKTPQAIILLKKAIEFNPDFRVAHNNLSVAYYYQRKYVLAIKHCDKAVDLGFKVNEKFFELLKPYRD